MNVTGDSFKRSAEVESNGESETDAAAERKKKRKSRWGGSEHDKAFVPGLPTIMPANMPKDQEEAYLLQIQIEEVSRRLRTNDLGIPFNPEERSPSPEPVYNHEGKRMNTREYRKRKKLDEERHFAIQKLMKINKDYKPPPDYKALFIRISEKVFIPVDEHPTINFLGLLIGPRGNTLRQMEKDTGSRIIIRGRGSIKEGKVAHKDGAPLPGEDEPLHAYVSGNNPDSVEKGVKKVKDIIKKLVDAPTGQTDWRKMQLRELALLNGTLREVEPTGPKCINCASTSHRSWQCTEKQNMTNTTICASCGGAGHIARDCRQRSTGGFSGGGGVDQEKFDQEYNSFMAELGGGSGNRAGSNQGRGISGPVKSLFSSFGPPKALINVNPSDAGVVMPHNRSRGESDAPSNRGPPRAFPPPPPPPLMDEDGPENSSSRGRDRGRNGVDNGQNRGRDQRRDMDYGSNRSMDYGSSRGMDYGSSRGMDYGSSRGMDYGSNRGMDYGSNSYGPNRVMDYGHNSSLTSGMNRNTNPDSDTSFRNAGPNSNMDGRNQQQNWYPQPPDFGPRGNRAPNPPPGMSNFNQPSSSNWQQQPGHMGQDPPYPGN